MSGERQPFHLSQPSKKNIRNSSLLRGQTDPQEGSSTSLASKNAISNPFLHKIESTSNSNVLKKKISIGKLVSPPAINHIQKSLRKPKIKSLSTNNKHGIPLGRKRRNNRSSIPVSGLSMPIIPTDVPVETSRS